MMSNKKIINIFNLLGFIFLLYASYLFRQKGYILTSDKVDIFFMPAPYAFSIWTIIYICLLIWIIKGFVSSPKESVLYKDVGLWFFISIILTGFSVLVPLKISFLFIIGALITSLIVYIVIDNSCTSKIYKIPFSLLCGWLSIAVIVNICLVLKSMPFTSFLFIGEIGWTLIILIFATLIAISFTLAKDDIIFSLVFIWAYVGIMIENPCCTILLRSIFFMCIVLSSTIVFSITNRNTEKLKQN